jgi:hypothetical protein
VRRAAARLYFYETHLDAPMPLRGLLFYNPQSSFYN